MFIFIVKVGQNSIAEATFLFDQSLALFERAVFPSQNRQNMSNLNFVLFPQSTMVVQRYSIFSKFNKVLLSFLPSRARRLSVSSMSAAASDYQRAIHEIDGCRIFWLAERKFRWLALQQVHLRYSRIRASSLVRSRVETTAVNAVALLIVRHRLYLE